ncbi:DNA cytosine methyltransferase [Massilia agilis]|uniref:DNA (cytosine-5-)-methyltransferase n=1 Tax=Massilia agilis TaxID=1811226 RepID=A0ABT2DGN2_9BURK|nr:DNA cytosine methyltransferase [Massilia agilis]MCS0810481.1 DNA cytosine methyltransferase [Massilia agilis]
MNHIELFAGCGGLSLGLESVGFDLLLANELSPMAAETFAYNFFGEDLAGYDTPCGKHGRPALRTKWLSSKFAATDLKQRLREDPRQYPALGSGSSDLKADATLKGSLVVGSIIQLNQWLARNPRARSLIKSGFGSGGVDLVSGGPPCQSFSMAGMRQYDNARNTLPMEFANFVQMVMPKMALLENVTGILRPFTVGERKIHAWFEVAKAFVAAGFVPLCLHVNAKFAGVAQNRPRFLMFLFRADIYQTLLGSLNAAEKELLVPSGRFFERATQEPDVEFEAGALPYFDVKDSSDLALFQNSFLAPLVAYSGDRTPFTVRDAIDDLRQEGGHYSPYLDQINTYLAPHVAPHKMENHEHRQNSPHVKRRFRIYQVLQQVSRGVQNEVQALLAGTGNDLSHGSLAELSAHWFLGEKGERIIFGKKNYPAMVQYLLGHQTKKQTQKALDPSAPAPAALSIPDDACHYEELRTLTVREMARIQSFPDNFAFRSKITTGGQMRKYEVPQYTQVGNAVPPLLGRAIGRIFDELLRRTNEAIHEPEAVVA